jgi:hypothetical protein
LAGHPGSCVGIALLPPIGKFLVLDPGNVRDDAPTKSLAAGV